MNQEQKDTIREELKRDYFKWHYEHRDSIVPADITDYWLPKLDQAYQSGFEAGAKDKVEEVRKAYGGCTKCYGKGYATVRYGFKAHADFIGDKSYEYGTKVHMEFCDCDRGKQLEKLIKR